ncbi:SoxR reducing system RseC family protein [Vogesella oryzae]|uniref:SoxR reducing system RseC family protein n=1 Tax=Vogesella oryzae TaxID=1735285 RepID=UPI001582408F|nr:SoxR reducing system RseC family protein [Vogesella oryzae]
MIETEARVLRVEPGFAWVEPRPHSPCGQCDPVSGCRSLQLARMFSLRQPQFRVLDPLGVNAGEQVKIAVPESGMLRSAGLLYAVPVSALLLGAMLASAAGELAAVAGGLFALLFSLLLVRGYSRRLAGDVRFQPHIASRASSSQLSVEFVRTCRSRS